MRLPSIATTMHWLPKRVAPAVISSGVRTAGELIDTLSAPASSSPRMSSTLRMPPPTVNGMKTLSATRRTMSMTMSRRSWLAVMSRKTKLVGALPVVDLRLLDRIAGVAQLEEVDALDHAAVLDIETGDDAFCEH